MSGYDSKVAQRLLNLMNTSGYNIIQSNGQRIYGPPPNWPPNELPPKHCEVFVGRIPRDCFEDELVPLFSSIGPLYQLRLMMDFTGSNRGFAYVMYTNESNARKAIQLLNNYEMRPNHRIGVVESVDNCRLFIGNIPPNLDRKQVFDAISTVTEGVVGTVLYYSNKHSNDLSENRGFAFIEYRTHRDAAMARRKLLPEGTKLFGTQLAIDWAIPEPRGDKKIMSSVTVLFVRYLNYVSTEDMIKSVFSFENELNVIRVKRIKNYAFIHYSDRLSAELALNRLTAMDLSNSPLSEEGGQSLEVKWSIPPDSAKSFDQNKLNSRPDHSYDILDKSLNPMASPFQPKSQNMCQSNGFRIKSRIGAEVNDFQLLNTPRSLSMFWPNRNQDIRWSHKTRKSLPGIQ